MADANARESITSYLLKYWTPLSTIVIVAFWFGSNVIGRLNSLEKEVHRMGNRLEMHMERSADERLKLRRSIDEP